MKHTCFLNFLVSGIFLLFATRASAQLVDQTHFYFCDSIGSEISFTETFSWQYIYQPTEVDFSGSQGITVYPSTFTIGGGKGGQFSVKVTIKIDSLAYRGATRVGCLGPELLTGPAGIWSSGQWYVIIDGYIYDPKIEGRAHLSLDTLDFGTMTVGGDTSLSLTVSVDTNGSVFRQLLPLNVHSPFVGSDSISPLFDSCNLPGAGKSIFSFRPSQVGRYIDSVFLYDPIRKDSTTLILLGEGVAASVPKNPVASELRIYPNPADREATISLKDGDRQVVTIYNVMGDAVMRIPENGEDYRTLNTSALPSGLYYLEAVTKQGVYRERLVVAH